MPLKCAVQSYNFTKAELDGSQWLGSLDRSPAGTTTRLSATMELICPSEIVTATSFPANAKDAQPLANLFRWTLGLESSEEFNWLDVLAAEAVNVQLIFDIYDRSLSVYEASGILESLAPARPIPEGVGRRVSKTLLKVFGVVARESRIPFVNKAAPDILSEIADSIPAADNRDDTLWYLHRFYQDHLARPHPHRSFGIEWRITRRLIQTVGSRLAGLAAALFFHGPAPGAAVAEPAIVVRGKVGLKPGYWEKNWLQFIWRPVEPKAYSQFKSNNALPDWRQNLLDLKMDLSIKPRRFRYLVE